MTDTDRTSVNDVTSWMCPTLDLSCERKWYVVLDCSKRDAYTPHIHVSHTRTHLTYSGLRGGLEHLKIETRSIDEMFESEMGEFVN
jgi:hypothetical protein